MKDGLGSSQNDALSGSFKPKTAKSKLTADDKARNREINKELTEALSSITSRYRGGKQPTINVESGHSPDKTP